MNIVQSTPKILCVRSVLCYAGIVTIKIFSTKLPSGDSGDVK